MIENLLGTIAQRCRGAPRVEILSPADRYVPSLIVAPSHLTPFAEA